MAKASNYKARMDNEKHILKTFTSSSVLSINESLEGIEADEIIENAYMKFEDNDMEYLARQYETQLLMSRLNKEKFRSGLHMFLLNTNKYIKENKLYNKFFKLCHHVYVTLDKRKVKRGIMVAYQNLLIQQYAYFAGTSRIITYGCTTDGKLLTTNEVVPGTTEISYKLRLDNTASIESIIRLYAKYGYKIEGPMDMNELSMLDQCNTNMVFLCSYYINEITKDMKIDKYKNPNSMFIIRKSDMTNYNNIDKLHQALRERNRLLPKQGVYISIKGIIDIKEVYIKEIIKDNKVNLIFKLKFNDETYTMGWYDLGNEVHYDMWRYGELLVLDMESEVALKNSTPANFSRIIESTVLQSYAKLVIDHIDNEIITIEEKQTLEELASADKPSMYYEIREVEHNVKDSIKYKHFNKNEFVETTKGIESYTRRLPIGERASEDAISYAGILGITLSPGYTFVRGFDRTVHKLK